MIDLTFTLQGEQLQIHLSNTLGDDLAPNPGLGMGLQQTQTRLELLYAGQASLSTQKSQTHFDLEIHMPLRKPEKPG